MLTVLDALYAAKATLKPEDYTFYNWNRCSVGHIYHAVHEPVPPPTPNRRGRASPPWAAAVVPSVYRDTLLAVIDANGIPVAYDDESPASVVSGYVRQHGSE